jgi:hypothetical protein
VNNLTDQVKLFVRAKKIFTNSIVNAYLGNKLIAHKKENKFLPAEMVSFALKKQDLLDNPGTEIIIKIEPQKI